ncbi:MAG TPA: efflux RND transporter periplasmic adaptor subunit, partial [Cytophagales bacterium]|nr:efflux RND transporter periplasmic adaptor subunit [Cytophagales bacterium]
MKKMKRIQIIGLVVVSVLLGGFGGLALRTGEQLEVHEYHHEEEQTYTCSMHPQIRQQGEGQCPICGMDLVPVGAMSSSTDIQLDQISMTAEAKALAQVQTIAVRYRSLGKTLQLAGSITVNSDQVQVVPALFAGRVESIVLSQEGDEVRAGQRIARLYAPEWIAAQQELLEAKKAQASQPQWLEAATQKLINLGVSASRVAEVLEKEKISQNWEVTVPSSGVVLGAPARIGEYLEEGQPGVT